MEHLTLEEAARDVAKVLYEGANGMRTLTEFDLCALGYALRRALRNNNTSTVSDERAVNFDDLGYRYTRLVESLRRPFFPLDDPELTTR